MQLNAAAPLGALNPAALTGRLGLGEGREVLGLGKKECSVLTHFASVCSSSESSPEPGLSSNRLPVLPAFQPFYPPIHVSHRTLIVLVTGYFLPLAFIHFSLPQVNQWYIASLYRWVLPLPSSQLHFYGPFSLFCGPSHPETVDIYSAGIGATLRHQEALLPVAPLGMDSAKQPLVKENNY